MPDDLAPARGCLRGAIIGAAMWAAALTGGALIYLAAWQAMP